MRLLMTLSAAEDGGRGRGWRGFRRPLRRRIERFNRRVFSRFSRWKAVRLIAAAREAATRIYIATRSLRKLLPLIPPAAFPRARNIAPVEISPAEYSSTFSDVKLEICARSSHLGNLAPRMIIACYTPRLASRLATSSKLCQAIELLLIESKAVG